MKYRALTNWFWGTLLLLAATFILVNQFNDFTDIGIGSLIAAILSIGFIVQCIANLHFAPLPIPFAVLYIIFQSSLELPHIQNWTLIIASMLASIGLGVLFPKKHWRRHYDYKHYSESGDHYSKINTENSTNDNNPSVSVNFGAVSRRLKAERLETAQLYCNFGAIEIFFDQVELNPNGAEAILNCSFGAIKLFIPKHWHIIDHLNCTLGGVDMDKHFSKYEENAPKLTLTGNVSCGGIEIRYI